MEKTYLVNLGKVDDIPIGQGRCFIVKDEEIAVFRSRDGKFYAIQNKCPHKKGPLSEGIIGGGKIVCPLHGHKFDLNDGEGSEKGECIRVYKIWQQYGQIIVEFPLDVIFQKADLN